MPYSAITLLCVTLFACVHVWAGKLRGCNTTLHSRFLSTGGGVAIAYVFMDLLPKLSSSDITVKNFFYQYFPYLERHVYITALLGFLLFFAIDRSQKLFKSQSYYFGFHCFPMPYSIF